MEFSKLKLTNSSEYVTLILGDDMFENIENLKLQSIYEGISAASASFVNKPSHFIIYKLYGTSEYTFDNGRNLVVSDGDILYIPKGSDYNVRKLSEGESRYIAVRFEADGLEGYRGLYRCPTYESIDSNDVFRNLNSLWLFGSGAKKNKCYALFYTLMASLSKDDEHGYIGHSARSILSAAMEYFESHIFDTDFSVEALINKSGVSGTYFRKCFLKSYGISPKEYIVEKRLSRARSILDGGDFGNISDVAKSVGFEDALYFGKVFKKKYGVSPTLYVGQRK